MANSSRLVLPRQTAPGLPQLAAHGRLVGRAEAVQDVRAGGGRHALGAEQVLDRQRHALEQPALARPRAAPSAAAAIASARSGVSVMKAFRPRWRSIAATCAGASSAAENDACPQPVAGGRQGEPGEIASFDHLRHDEVAVMRLGRVARGCRRGRPPSRHRVRRASAARIGMTERKGSTPSVSTSPSCSIQPMICDSSAGEPLLLLLRDLDSREHGDAGHGGLVEGHARQSVHRERRPQRAARGIARGSYTP